MPKSAKPAKKSVPVAAAKKAAPAAKKKAAAPAKDHGKKVAAKKPAAKEVQVIKKASSLKAPAKAAAAKDHAKDSAKDLGKKKVAAAAPKVVVDKSEQKTPDRSSERGERKFAKKAGADASAATAIPTAKTESKVEPKAETKSEAKVESRAEAKIEAKAPSTKAPKARKVEEEIAVKESAPVEIVLTDAEGRRYCRVKECDQLSTVDGGYCRYHYLLFWRNIQNRKKILSEGKLERYVEELTARYPDKFLELLRKDLRSEKDFMAAIQELEIDESGVDAEFEDEAQNYLDEVRGMGSEPSNEREEDF